jgi:hypothetical protein
MKQIISILLFLLQCFCIFNGARIFGTDGNPIVLLAASLGIAVIYLQLLYSGGIYNNVSGSKYFIGSIYGALTIAIAIPFCYTLFKTYLNYASLSDVLTQLDTQYTRFATGIFPYAPIEQYDWHPYPVYMPLNWLPLGLAHMVSIDIRWVGIAALLLASILWGGYVWQTQIENYKKAIAIFFPAFPLYAYIAFLGSDTAISLETLIAGYYVILAIGLIRKNLYLISVGLVLCLLSRYTLVFWLPLFAILYWQNKTFKSNMMLWAVVIAAIIIIYIIPFYSQQPDILTKGIAYHNNCAVQEWNGYGEDKVSYTFISGVYFAHYYKNLLTGSNEEKVMWARIVQAILMLSLNVWGLYYYHRNKKRLDYGKFVMVMLYLFVLFFYMFSPLLYRYYYIVLLSLSAILCGQIILTRARSKNITP